MRAGRWCWVAFCSLWAGMLLNGDCRAAEVVLESDPPGTWISVGGPVSVSGHAPLLLGGLPDGDYDVIADGPGLAAARGRLVRSAETMTQRPWAGRTALVSPPGLVHLQHGEDRGWVYLGAGVAAATLILAKQASVRDAEDDRAIAQLTYRRAESLVEIARARQDLLAASQARNDHEEVRNLWTVYLGLTWLAAGAEALFLTPQPQIHSTSPGRYLAVLPRSGRWQTGLRSVLVPGSGQRYVGRGGRGAVFLAATTFLAAGAITAQDAFLEARRDQSSAQRRYDRAGTEAEIRDARQRLLEADDRAQDRSDVRWVLVGAASAVYLWNVFDAAGLGQQMRIPEMAWSVAPTANGVLAAASWSIP